MRVVLLHMRKLVLFMLSEPITNVIMQAILLHFTNPKPIFSYANDQSAELMLPLGNSKELPIKNMVP